MSSGLGIRADKRFLVFNHLWSTYCPKMKMKNTFGFSYESLTHFKEKTTNFSYDSWFEGQWLDWSFTF